LVKKRNELTEAQDRLKTVGKEGYMRLAAEVETYKASDRLSDVWCEWDVGGGGEGGDRFLSPSQSKRVLLNAHVSSPPRPPKTTPHPNQPPNYRHPDAQHPPYTTPPSPHNSTQRRRADGLSFVRDSAGKEAVKTLVPVLDLFEELEAKYAGVTDEASLKVLGGYRNLQNVFEGKAERLGLTSFVPGT
jgi:hypothetical protein